MRPDKWEENESFKIAKDFVRTVKVVNDTAERGVKMAEDYAAILTKDNAMKPMAITLQLFSHIDPTTLKALWGPKYVP